MRYLALPILLALTFVAGCRSSDDLHVERLDVALNVLVDGSIEVEERLTLKAGSSGGSEFRRRVAASRHDGVFGISGSMNGKDSASGSGVGELLGSAGPALDVVWTMAPAPDTHQLLLRYRASNAVEISGIRGTVAWRVLDADPVYAGAQACVTLTLPAGAIVLENPGFDEATATAASDRPDAACATASGQQPLTRRVTFTTDTMAVGEPVWQYNARRARDLMPAFVSTALCLVAVGIGIVALVRFRYPVLTARPDDPPTPVAAALESALAKGGPYGYDLEKLIDAGLVERERVNAARDLRRAGYVTLAIGAGAWLFTAWQLDHFGRWPFAVPAAVLFCGALFVVCAPRLSVLSQTGVNTRLRVLYSARVQDGRTSV